MSRLTRLLWCLALATSGFAQVPLATPPATLSGEVTEVDGLRIVHVWGAPRDAGYAHGWLLAQDVVGFFDCELRVRYGQRLAAYRELRARLPELIEMPTAIDRELRGIAAGVRARLGDDAHSALLGRALDVLDLWYLNSLDALTRFGCSGAVVWGDRTAQSRIWAARNFDWLLTSPAQLRRAFVLVHHDDPHSHATITWPGYVGAVSGVNDAGVAVWMHLANGASAPADGRVTPLAAHTRAILRRASARQSFIVADEILAATRPGQSFLVCVVRPPVASPPVAVFEIDATGQRVRSDRNPTLLANHYLDRPAPPPAWDSRQRQEILAARLETPAPVTAGDLWCALAAVQRPHPKGFPTLHAFVYSPEPFEWQIALAAQGERFEPAPARPPVKLDHARLFGAAMPDGGGRERP